MWPCEGVWASSMPQRSASSFMRRHRPGGGSSQGHTATWEHGLYLLVPARAVEDTPSHIPQRQKLCRRWEVRYQGQSWRSQRLSQRRRREYRSSSRRARTRRQ